MILSSTLGDEPRVVVVDHPLAQHCLARLRDRDTTVEEFRRLVDRVTPLLAARALEDLELASVEVQTPLALAEGRRLAQRIALAPVLRAGLGMVEPLLTLVPEAVVWHVGLYRDEATARPVEYYAKTPRRGVDVAVLLDPMLATGGSAVAALEKLRQWQAPVVKVLSVIAAEEGVRHVNRHFPQAQIFTLAVDPTLNEHKFIVPGLGDAGDRIFGT
jgi:uracil phosphoribosyltransferase